jgi:peptidoglycan/LPS O-acetylase OafA/YrhL
MAASRTRLGSLDGLRGIAALVVLIHHTLLINPALAARYRTSDPHTASVRAWALTYTPLHLPWSGAEAVDVFFVLSGFVLALPWASGAGPRWLSYYPSRLIRLYLPVWGSLVLAFGLIHLVHRRHIAGASWWLNVHATHPHGVHETLVEAVLVDRSGWVSSPLWSLKWEVLFSLLLPAYLVFGGVGHRWWAVKLAAIAVLMTWAVHEGHRSLVYLPMFAIGVLIAYHREALLTAGARITRRGWWTLFVVCLIAIDASWYVDLLGLVGTPRHDAASLAQVVAAFAGGGFVFAAMAWGAARTTLERPVVRWLGRRSFSLYLVHEPIVVTLAFLTHARLATPFFAALAIPVSLLAAELFYRTVEGPAHRLAGGVKRRLAGPAPVPRPSEVPA